MRRLAMRHPQTDGLEKIVKRFSDRGIVVYAE